MNRAGAYGKCVLVMLYSKVIDDVDCCHWSAFLIGIDVGIGDCDGCSRIERHERL